MIKFWRIFVYGEVEWSCFVRFWYKAIRLDYYHLLKILLSLIEMPCFLCQKANDHIWGGLFLDFLFLSIDLFVYFYAIYNINCLNYCGFIIILKIRQCISFNFIFKQSCFDWDSLHLQRNFSMSLLISKKKMPPEIGIGVVLNL